MLQSKTQVKLALVHLVFLCLVGAHTRSSAQIVPDDSAWGSYYNLASNQIAVYPISNGARFQSINVGVPGQVTFTMKGTLPAQADRFGLAVYFDADIALVYAHGGYSVPTSPPVAAGSAALVRPSDRSVISSAGVSISGNTITVTFNPQLIGTAPLAYAVSCYLPSGHTLENVSGGFGTCYVDSIDLYAESPTDQNSSARRFEIYCRIFSTVVPNTIPFGMPSRGPEFYCPPRGPRANTIPKPRDINGDSIPDWQYPVHCPVPGTGKIIGVWGLDLPPAGASSNDEYVVVIGTDSNGNNKLDPAEVESAIGRCPYPGGRNKWWLQKHGDGKWYVHAISRWPEEAGGSQIGKMIHYIYDPSTNTLKVFVIDRNGTLLDTWTGDPANCPYLRAVDDE